MGAIRASKAEPSCAPYRRDPVGIRLITRNGHDWAARYPLVVEAVNRSCLIDGEVVCCDEKGVAAFLLLRHRRNEPQAFLYAFDLLELNGAPSCARLGTAFA
jgi:bifunctional non-homologous end joining protein LigD